MKEIRIHGRGGQGSVVTAELFAIAAHNGGLYSQAFPYLGGGGERRGAPVQAFTRIDNKPIRIRSKIYEPDYIIINDITLIKLVDVASGLKQGGMVIVNTEKKPSELALPQDLNIKTINATQIAVDIIGRPIMNTAVMGAFAAFTGEFDIGSIQAAISQRFSGAVVDKNIAAAIMAYEQAKKQ